jgi:hypothetical protein
MPVPTSAVKVNPVTGALIDPPVATFAAANGLLTGGSSDAKDSVRAATTTNGTLATAFENGDTIDGIVLATGDRILIKNQSAPAENGIYVVAASGAPARATDFDAWTEIVGAFVSVEAGTANAGTQWLCNVVAGGTLGTTAINFVVPQNYVNLTTNQTVAGNKHFATGSTIGGVEISKDTVNPAVNGSIQFLEDDSIFALSANAGPLWVHTTGTTDVTFPLSGTLLSSAAIGVSVQAYDADLTTWAGITPGAGVATALAVANNSAGGYSPIDGTATLSNKTLTAPKFASGGFIADANGNELLIFTTTASAVNELTYANAATGVSPTLTASGGDTNISISLVPKGTGGILIPNGAAATPAWRFASDTDCGAYYIGTNNFGFATAGVLRWHISSSGHLFSGSGNYDYNIAASLLLGSSGSATAPTFSFGSSGDTNSGMYRVGEDQIGFTAGGTLRLTVSTTGVTLANALAVTGATTLTGLLTANGGITLGDAQNIAFNTTTGTKIGAATTQKLSFWNATPIVQPTTAVSSATVASPGGGTNLKTDDTFDGYTIAQVVKALRNAGLLA